MSDSVNIVLLVLLAVAALFIIKKLYQGTKVIKSNGALTAPSQFVQETKKKDKNEEKNLTLEEKIEMSWTFLTSITEKVLNYFSPQDQKVIHQAGKILAQHGAKYQHNIHAEAKITLENVKSKEKNQDQSISR